MSSDPIKLSALKVANPLTSLAGNMYLPAANPDGATPALQAGTIDLLVLLAWIQENPAIKSKVDATAAPTTGDDTGDGYSVGSIWCDVTNDKAYICLDATSTAAVWFDITQSGGGLTNKYDATAAPTTGDDTGDGYSVGSIWCDVTNDKAYICLDATSTAAVWFDITQSGGGLTNKYDATAAPTTGDDTGDGYSVGSIWCDVTNDKAYICLDATSTAAVWFDITQSGGGLTNKYDATAAPTAGDDTGDGYSVGSIWCDVTNDKAYICLDATSAAAVWFDITQSGGGLTNKYDATAALTAGDDTGDGYSVGSIWCDVTNDKAYICLDATSAAAVWFDITQSGGGLTSKYDATAAPTAGDDTGDGYSVGSIWCDVTNDKAYICLDATSAAAVWFDITQSGGDITNPAVGAPALYLQNGADVHRVFIDTGDGGTLFLALDPTPES